MLIGRDRELARLGESLTRAEAGRGSVHLLCGDAGIGKTRLADELSHLGEQRHFAVHWGRAWETGGAPAYWPWIEIVRTLTRDFPLPSSSPLHRLLGTKDSRAHGDGTAADPASERFVLFDGMLSFLRECALQRPLLLVFDDLHAADIPSLELLSFLARSLRSIRAVVLGTYRDREIKLSPVEAIVARVERDAEIFLLKPMSKEQLGKFVAAEGHKDDHAFVSRLYEVTEGNPLFIREALRTVGRAEDDGRMDALANLPSVGGISSLVENRLARLTGAELDALEMASAIGRVVSLSLLVDASNEAERDVRTVLDRLVGYGFLLDQGRDEYRFSHLLLLDAVYRKLSLDRRRAIHHAIASALDRRVMSAQEEGLATLAHHATLALPVGDPNRAIEFARRAADRARSQLAYEEAISLLVSIERATEKVAVVPNEKIELLLSLGWATTEAGDVGRGRDYFRSAARMAKENKNPVLFARAALGQGGEYVLGEIRDELVNVLREALVTLPLGERDLRARCLARLAAALQPSATPEEPVAMAREALAMIQDSTDARTRAHVTVAVGSAFADFARADERIEVNDTLVRTARTLGDRVLELRGLTRLATDLIERGDLARADAAIETRTRLANQIGHPRYRWQSSLLQSMRSMISGRFGQSIDHVAEAQAVSREAPDTNAEHVLTVHQFWLWLLAGRTDELRAHEPAILQTMDRMPGGSTYHTWISAIVSARTGDVAHVRNQLLAVANTGFLNATMSLATTADAALLSNTEELFASLYDQLFPFRDENATWGPFGFACGIPISTILGSLAAKMGKRENAMAHFEFALERAAAQKADGAIPWASLWFAESLVGKNDERASQLFASALEYATRLRMPEVERRAKWTEHRRQPSVRPRASEKGEPIALVKDGEIWELRHRGRTLRLRALRGFAMLARLIEHPNEEMHALDLISLTSAGAADTGDAGEAIDARALESYRARMRSLREEIAEAERRHDLKLAELREELEALTEQLSSSVGLGGQARRAGSAAERARVAVQRRIREAIRKVAEQDPQLGRDLDWTVRTGTFCAYEPEGRKRSGRSQP